MTALVLASRSAARREMLTRLGLEFEAVDSGLDEAPLKSRLLKEGADPAEVAARLASAKAEAASAGRPGALVLGSDQTLEVDADLVDKARDLAEARRRLQRLRGRDHILHSAVALAVDGQTVWTDRDQARMTMRSFTDAFLDRYLAAEGDAVLGSVGCYRLEGLGGQLFDRVQGDWFTVMGMPLWPLLAELRRRGALAS